MSNVSKLNFTGVLTPKIDVRIDTEVYASGCRRLDNMIPTVYGLVTRRPGTELIVAGNGAACYYEAITPDPAKIGITTVAELALIGNDGAFPLDGDYELLNNLDLDVAPYNSAPGWIPIGDRGGGGQEFTGTFDGNFFTISNMFIDSDDNARGLFGQIRSGTIENLLIMNAVIRGDVEIGVLAGEVIDTNIHKVGTTGTIYLSHAGFGGDLIGGIVGECSEGVGTDVSFTECWSIVDIVGDYSGFADGRTGGISGNDAVHSVSDCWSGGNWLLQGVPSLRPYFNSTGGFWGDGAGIGIEVALTNCFSYGKIITSQGEFQGSDINGRIGGFMGRYTGIEPISCYWDTETSTMTNGVQGGNIAGVTGKTTAQMQAEATFAGYDFDTVWEINEGSGYPTLQWSTSGLGFIRSVCQAV